MKRVIGILFLFINICNLIFAEPADLTFYNVVQPNGDTICVSLCGDEYGAWYQDINGNIIEENKDGYWVYVTIENGVKVLTNQIASQISIPMDINKDSVFNVIMQHRVERYIEMNQDLYSNAATMRNGGGMGEFAPLPTTGQRKILSILVQFADVAFQNPNEVKQEIINMMNQVDYCYPGQTEITGSMRDFYLEASYNKLDISSTVIGPYTVSQNRAYYGDNINGVKGLDSHPQELAQEVMKMIVDDIDVNQFDNNGDGWVECIHIIYAGQGENVNGAPKEAIWPHKWSLVNAVDGNGIKMSRYIMTPELYINSYRGVGTICHELGHILGAPDFYDVANNYFKGTGKFDLMCSGNWNGSIPATCPAQPSPYIKKEIFGWIESVEELSGNNKEYILRPSELDSNGIYKLSTSTEGEYYFLENRQDMHLPGTGLVVYHVSADMPNRNINISHPQKLYVVDANNHIAKPTGTSDSYGDIDSIYATFRDTITNNIFFTSQTKPSNCDWAGNVTQNKDVCFIIEEETDGETCIKFILNPEIEGPDMLCDSALYSLKHVPAGATIEWTYVAIPGMTLPDVPVLIGSGQGTTEVCYKRGIILEGGTFQDTLDVPDVPFVPVPASITPPTFVPYSGDVTIKVNITFNGNTHSLFKTITMPEESKDIEIERLNFGSLNVWCKGVTKTMTLKSSSEENWMNDVIWYVDVPGHAPYFGLGSSISVTPTATGTATIIATLPDECNPKSDTAVYQIVQILGTSFVNPVSGSVEINIIGGDELGGDSNVSTMALDNQTSHACRLELWHDVYGKVREMDVLENTSVVTMDLGGLTSGIYVLRLIVDNQIVETSQMIII